MAGRATLHMEVSTFVLLALDEQAENGAIDPKSVFETRDHSGHLCRRCPECSGTAILNAAHNLREVSNRRATNKVFVNRKNEKSVQQRPCLQI